MYPFSTDLCDFCINKLKNWTNFRVNLYAITSLVHFGISCNLTIIIFKNFGIPFLSKYRFRERSFSATGASWTSVTLVASADRSRVILRARSISSNLDFSVGSVLEYSVVRFFWKNYRLFSQIPSILTFCR